MRKAQGLRIYEKVWENYKVWEYGSMGVRIATREFIDCILF